MMSEFEIIRSIRRDAPPVSLPLPPLPSLPAFQPLTPEQERATLLAIAELECRKGRE
jgi:hypothetical protein